MLENVEKRLFLKGLLVHIDDDLPKVLFSNAAYHITKCQLGLLLHPFLPLRLQDVLCQELDRPKTLNARKGKQLVLIEAQQFFEVTISCLDVPAYGVISLDRNEIQRQIRTQETNLWFARSGVGILPGQQELDVFDIADRSFVRIDPVPPLALHRNGVKVRLLDVLLSKIIRPAEIPLPDE